MATQSGTDNDDILVGTSGVDTINGGAGNDTIEGRAGNDIIDGGAGNDKLYGGLDNDTLDGLDGSDWLYGGLGNDTIDGGDGFDRIDFRDSLSAVVVDFATGTATGQDIGTDTIQNIERVIGSDFDDSLTGSNTAAASYNWEEFTGGLGNDTIDGGGGVDAVWYGRSSALVHVDLSTGIVTGGEGTDQLTSIEWVTGSNFADTLLGSENGEGFAPDALGNTGAGSNFNVGGVDVIDGKGGIDTVYYDNTKNDGGFTPTGIEADLALGTVIDPAGNTDQLTSIENITGSAYDDNIKGDSGANHLQGRAGNDTIEGGDGDDIIDGGAGDDIIDNGSGNDFIYGKDGNDTFYNWSGTDYYDGGEGIDTIISDFSPEKIEGILDPQSFDFYLNLEEQIHGLPEWTTDPDTIINVENYTLIGDFNAEFIGDEKNNILISDLGNDVIQGRAGNDTIEGGAGNDWLYGGDGDDTITLTADSTWGTGYFARNVSNDNSVGSNQRISIKGLNRFNDVIDGGDDVDMLNLTAGNDAFSIDDVYSEHHSSLTLSSTTQGTDSTARAIDLETINAGGGNDIIDLTSSNFILNNAVTINGEAGNDTLWGSNGDDVINGGDGNDTIFGGAGNDTLTGGAGDDIFQFTATAGSDVITDFNVTDDTIKLYYRAEDEHTNADLSLSNGVLTWSAGDSNNVLIDFSATTTSSDLNDVDSLITFVEIV